MSHPTVSDLFRRHNRPSPEQERLTREASQLLQNSNDGRYVIAEVSKVATVMPALQDDYLQHVIRRIGAKERLVEFMEEASTTLRTPPVSYIADAKTVMPLMSDWASTLSRSCSAVWLACVDLSQIHDDVSHSIGGCFMYNAMLPHEERNGYTTTMEAAIAKRIESLNGMVKIAAAVTNMPQTDGRRFSEHSILEARAIADRYIALHDTFTDDFPVAQTERQAIQTVLNRTISNRCEDAIGKGPQESFAADALAVSFWQEVLANLPASGGLPHENQELNAFLARQRQEVNTLPFSD